MIIAHEKTLPLIVAAHEQEGPLFVRIDISEDIDEELLTSLGKKPVVPMLFHGGRAIHPARLEPSVVADLIELHVVWAEKLHDMGFDRIALAADNDGAWQKMLSPRYNTAELEQRIEPLLELYERLKAVNHRTTVVLPVEELAPGGLDATDGIAIARELEQRGLSEIIATAGTKDFWPLYDRRMTQKKRSDLDDFYSHEPSLASALWLIQHISLTVWCLAFFDDLAQASVLAQDLGLVGIINKLPIDI